MMLPIAELEALVSHLEPRLNEGTREFKAGVRRLITELHKRKVGARMATAGHLRDDSPMVPNAAYLKRH